MRLVRLWPAVHGGKLERGAEAVSLKLLPVPMLVSFGFDYAKLECRFGKQVPFDQDMFSHLRVRRLLAQYEVEFLSLSDFQYFVLLSCLPR